MTVLPASGLSPGRAPLTLRQRRRLNPPWPARAVIGLTVATLPPEHRERYERYEREFYAEVYGRRPDQVRHAAGLLVHAWSLTMSATETHPLESEERPMSKDLRCVFHLHHYVRRHNPEADGIGQAYLECTRCRKMRDIPYRPIGPM